MLNPFTIRGTLQNPAEFIGRGTEINDIITRLRSMQSCSVVGERRIGKSSLLYHLAQTGVARVGDENYRFLYMELYNRRLHANRSGLFTHDPAGIELPDRRDQRRPQAEPQLDGIRSRDQSSGGNRRAHRALPG
jgi:hypothetical protein